MASIFRSERAAAVILLVSAVLGLVAANSAWGASLLEVQGTHFAIPGTGIDLSVGHWISDGLLAIFFFVVAVELKHELTVGQLDTPSKAVRPAIAAVGGVIVPVLLYLLVTAGSGLERGWPIPTATDIAFALGVLAIFGRGIPGRLRVFLLALAILDDLIAIVIIAVFFTADADFWMLGAAVAVILAFGAISRALGSRWQVPVIIALVVLAVLAWAFVYLSGVHATIAGVGLGLMIPEKWGMKARHALEPTSNGFVLPLFAFSAALVAIPEVPIAELRASFWAILIALPVGKMIGITFGGWIAGKVGARGETAPLGWGLLTAAGALGGIGFTVSLLMNELAFATDEEAAAEGTLAVLLGSAVSILTAIVLLRRQSRYYRRLRELRESVAETS